MDVSGSSLRELYSSAKSKQEELDSGSAAHQEILQSAISAFEECRKLIVKLAVFSSNEEAEDISTQDLRYSPIYPSFVSIIDTFPDISRSITCWQSSCLEAMKNRLDCLKIASYALDGIGNILDGVNGFGKELDTLERCGGDAHDGGGDSER